MARVRVGAITSLDGYVADADGRFDWAAPDEEVHAFVNGLERDVGTYLYGRRMYDVMRFWEQPAEDDWPPVMHEYAAVWRAADKIVYSSSLGEVSTTRTQLRRTFDPDEVRRIKAASSLDLSVSGPTLAAAAWRADLVDDVYLFLVPVVVGGGTRALPDGVRASLTLVAERRFGNGTVHLQYRVER